MELTKLLRDTADTLAATGAEPDHPVSVTVCVYPSGPSRLIQVTMAWPMLARAQAVEVLAEAFNLDGPSPTWAGENVSYRAGDLTCTVFAAFTADEAAALALTPEAVAS